MLRLTKADSFFIYACTLVVLLLFGSSGVRAGWQLVWDDEFNDATLNTNNWTYDTGNGFWVANPGYWVSGWGNNELEDYTSRTQNVYLANGCLHLRAQQEAYGSQSYTSGRIKTKGIFSQTCGRFEFRAQLPAGAGLWPALWMLPDNSPYGGWPNSGEIDVMENKGQTPTQVGGTIHYGGANGNDVYSGATYTFSGGDSVTNFHTYAVEWTSNSISWYVDSNLYQTRNNWYANVGTTTSKYPYPAPFDQPFYMLMNLAVGGNYLGNPATNAINASLPGEMLVDYVRVYNWVSTPATPVLQLRLPFNDAPGTTTTASDTSSGGVNVSLQMANAFGGAADYHGAAGSGVMGAISGGRALDFSVNATQPGIPGPVAAVTNASLGFGVVSNFTVTCWIKQGSQMTNGSTIGPRLFVMGAGTPDDSGAANSVGLKFQSPGQLQFQLGATTVSANFASGVPTNTWLFVAATYDGHTITVYQGTESNSVSALATGTVTTNVNFGNSAALYAGNRQDRQRSFDGWLADFRFYTGSGSPSFVESIRAQAVSFNSPLAGQPYTPPAGSRTNILLDANWRFIAQDVAGAQTNGFDDSTWSALSLPHTWNNLDGQDGGNNYYRGIGWYRSHYTVAASLTNRLCFLKFDGAFCVADVYVNGNFVGEHQGGFAAFVFDVTAYLNVGADNIIAVKVNNASNANIPPLSGDFTMDGGLYRDVHLLVTDPVQISPLDYGSPGVYLKPTNVSAGSANLQINTLVSNATATAQIVTVRAVVVDADTNIVTVLTNTLTLPAASLVNVQASTTIASPHLWNGLADPYLYRAFIELYNGTNLTDLVSQPLGFRSFSVDANTGFYLNGSAYDLHGVSMHQDWLNCGWALTNAQRETNFALLKEIGATVVRLSHYQNADYTYQLADQAGIVIWTEIPLINSVTSTSAFSSNAVQQLVELIRQNYNHPSVCFWGLYNEITSTGQNPTSLISQLAQTAAQEDSTRLTTAASNSSDNAPTTLYSQVIDYNKYYGWYGGVMTDFGPWADNFHATYPTQAVGVSEYGAGASIYQHGENPVGEPANAGPYHPEEYQNQFHESYWQQIKARPFLWSKIIWNMFDFAADGRNEGDTPGRNDKGLVTYDRQVRKDAFYWYKANWTTDPMVYITGHTFTNRIKNISAKVYANCDTVELFVNGASQGVRTSTNSIFIWPVTLAAGTNSVLAVGTKGGATVNDSLVWITSGSSAPAVLKLRLPFDDAAGTATTSSDTSSGGVNVTLQMVNGSGTAADYHGATDSGVGATLFGGRALDFSSNTMQPGNTGPLASVTDAKLGFGVVSNFTVSCWFKQDSLMGSTANIGPRVFVLGAGTPGDAGATNSIGLKFQMANQLYFQLGTTTVSANFATNLPANVWLFIAATYDGSSITVYEGTESNSVTVVATGAVVTNVNFGSSATLYIGNRQDRQRSFDGWIDDFQFYIGGGDASFVENIRAKAATLMLPTAVSLASSQNPSGNGDAVAITANVTPSAATGTMQFFASNSLFATETLTGGTATSIPIAALPRGTNLITAIYSGDNSYQPATNTMSQVVTNHPPGAAPATVYRTPGRSVNIALADLATNWSDADGDPVSLAGINVTTTNGVLVATNATQIIYPNAANVNDQMNYTIADGLGGFGSGTINIVMVTPGQVQGVGMNNGSVALHFSGMANWAYTVQRSTNLVNWSGIWTTNAPANGLFDYTDNFLDLGGTIPNPAFYRLLWTQ